MEQKYDIILIGPQMAGKTTLLKSLQGNDLQEYVATQSNGEYTKVSTGNWLGRILKADKKILDAGGKFNEFVRYSEWCKQSKIIVFVFNGCELIEEIKDPSSPGKNTSFCRNVFLMLKKDVKDANMCFVATHTDMYSSVDMVSFIQQALKNADDSYENMFPNMSKRYYPFDNMMQGRLFAVNAKDKKATKKLFDKIFDL